MIPVIGALASAFGLTALLNWLLLDPTAHRILRQRLRHAVLTALNALVLICATGIVLTGSAGLVLAGAVGLIALHLLPPTPNPG